MPERRKIYNSKKDNKVREKCMKSVKCAMAFMQMWKSFLFDWDLDIRKGETHFKAHFYALLFVDCTAWTMFFFIIWWRYGWVVRMREAFVVKKWCLYC